MAENKTTRKKRKKKKGVWDTAKQFSRFEMLFIIVLFLCFFAWAFSKCSREQSAAPPSPVSENNTPLEDDGADISPAAANNPNSPTYDLKEDVPVSTTTSGVPTTTPTVAPRNTSTSSRRSYTPLYVTLQDLKVRKAPSLDSTIITLLQLHDEVMFMDKRTNFREKINIGNGEITNEPWIYIRTRKGQTGWVYGAGVHYFKWDRLRNPIPSISDEPE